MYHERVNALSKKVKTQKYNLDTEKNPNSCTIITRPRAVISIQLLESGGSRIDTPGELRHMKKRVSVSQSDRVAAHAAEFAT